MKALATFEQAPLFDPYNPNQQIREAYVGIPGGYGSFYFNRVPSTSSLQGLAGDLGMGWATVPSWAQALAVGVLGLAAGFYGSKYLRNR
jgi:hypothetical protein